MAFLKKYLYKSKINELNWKDGFYSLKDFDDTFSMTMKIMSFFRIRIAQEETNLARRLWAAFYWFEVANLAGALILDLFAVKELYETGSLNDLSAIFGILPCCGYLTLGMFRSYKMVSSRDIYDNLICELRGMWPQGRVSEEEHATLAPTLTRLHNVINGYFWCNVFLTVSFIAPPYIDIIKRAIGLPNPRILPFTYGLLPFDQLQPVYFEIILTLQTWQTLLTVFFIVCGDIFFCVLLSHITAQFDLLCIRITRLIFVPIDGQLIAEYPLGRTSVKLLQTNKDLASLESTLQEEIILRELKEIAERHDTLIRFSNYLERLYSFPLLVNFIYSSIIICFCAIFIVMIENITEFKYKLFLITSLSQIWVLCYYGETLPKSSRNVSTALYNCGWYNSSVKVRRSIHIMITRAQKFVYISTYGFSIICLENYTKIIKTAWSYFTILLNAYNPDIE